MPERIPNGVAKKVVFRAIASVDHFTPATGKTIAVTISKNGALTFGNAAAGATNATEMASGFYKFDLGTGDTDTNGPLAWRAAGTGVDDIGDVYEVVAATNGGFSALPAVASGSAGAVITSGTGTAQLSVSGGTAKADVDTIKTQAVTAAAGVTFPSSIASPTNITAATGITVSTNNDKTGYALSSAGVQAVWDALTSALTTVGSIGKRIADYLTGDAYVRLGAPVGASISADIAARPSAATIAGAVWDVTLASHLTAGTTGYALNAAGAAGDPWTTALPGAYAAGSAGYIVGTNLNAAITSRMATYTQPTGFLAATFPGTVASPTNITAATGVVLSGVTHTGAVIPTVSAVTGLTASDVAAIKAKTDLLTFTVAGNVDANMQYINDTLLTGNGGAGTEFGV